MGIRVYGNGCHTSSMERDIEWLRRQAYKTVCMENRDIPKVDKIIDGIKSGKINKENLYGEVRGFTKRVTSDHSIKRWQIITEWFGNIEWFC